MIHQLCNLLVLLNYQDVLLYVADASRVLLSQLQVLGLRGQMEVDYTVDDTQLQTWSARKPRNMFAICNGRD